MRVPHNWSGRLAGKALVLRLRRRGPQARPRAPTSGFAVLAHSGHATVLRLPGNREPVLAIPPGVLGDLVELARSAEASTRRGDQERAMAELERLVADVTRLSLWYGWATADGGKGRPSPGI